MEDIFFSKKPRMMAPLKMSKATSTQHHYKVAKYNAPGILRKKGIASAGDLGTHALPLTNLRMENSFKTSSVRKINVSPNLVKQHSCQFLQLFGLSRLPDTVNSPSHTKYKDWLMTE